jgi:hypothetical protein
VRPAQVARGELAVFVTATAVHTGQPRVFGRHELSIDALLADERARPLTERVDAVAIVTPNHLHAPIAIAALNAGFPVFSEKPMAMNLAEARAAVRTTEAVGRAGAEADRVGRARLNDGEDVDARLEVGDELGLRFGSGR